MDPADIYLSLQRHTTVIQYLLPMISVYGVLSNAANIHIVSRRFRTAMTGRLSISYYSLIGLSGADLVVCLAALPLIFLPSVFEGPQWGPLLLYAILGPGLVNVGLTVSAWMVTLMSIGRCVAITRPLIWRSFSHRSSVNTAIFSSILGLAVLLRIPDTLFTPDISSLPLMYLNKTTSSRRLLVVQHSNSPFLRHYRLLLIVLVSVLPLLLTSTSTAIVILGLVRPSLPNPHSITSTYNEMVAPPPQYSLPEPTIIIQQHQQSLTHRSIGYTSESRIIRLLVSSIAVFLLFCAPFEVLHFVLTSLFSSLDTSMIHLVSATLLYTNMLQVFGCAIHSSIYLVTSKHYRRHFIRLAQLTKFSFRW